MRKKPVITLALNDPSQWPLRMTFAEVAHVMRVCHATLFARIKSGRMFRADSDHKFERDAVIRYIRGGIKRFDEECDKRERYERRHLKAVSE